MYFIELKNEDFDESTIECEIDLKEIFGDSQIKHKYGTTYRVRLNDNGYRYMKERLENQTLQDKYKDQEIKIKILQEK